MANTVISLVNVGTAPNDGTGTPLRDAFIITNSNVSNIVSVESPVIAGAPGPYRIYELLPNGFQVARASNQVLDNIGAPKYFVLGATTTGQNAIGYKAGSRISLGNSPILPNGNYFLNTDGSIVMTDPGSFYTLYLGVVYNNILNFEPGTPRIL